MMFYLKSKNGFKWVSILNLDDFFCVSALSFFSQENILIIQKFENWVGQLSEQKMEPCVLNLICWNIPLD